MESFTYHADVRIFRCQRQGNPLQWIAMAFVNVQNIPPSGYQVFVPETGFSTRPYTGLEDTVNELVFHRQANSRFGWPTDKDSIRAWVLSSVEARLRAMPGGAGMGWLVPDSPPPDQSFFLPRRQQQPSRAVVERNAVAVVEQVKNTLAGIGLWMDFFGSGPVAPELAAHRAATCARCPQNKTDGNWLSQFNEAAAKEITAIFGSLKHAKLSTPHDEMLGFCAACSCPNRSNVWTPIDLKLKRLRPEAKAQLDPSCWVLAEEKTAALSD